MQKHSVFAFQGEHITGKKQAGLDQAFHDPGDRGSAQTAFFDNFGPGNGLTAAHQVENFDGGQFMDLFLNWL